MDKKTIKSKSSGETEEFTWEFRAGVLVRKGMSDTVRTVCRLKVNGRNAGEGVSIKNANDEDDMAVAMVHAARKASDGKIPKKYLRGLYGALKLGYKGTKHGSKHWMAEHPGERPGVLVRLTVDRYARGGKETWSMGRTAPSYGNPVFRTGWNVNVAAKQVLGQVPGIEAPENPYTMFAKAMSGMERPKTLRRLIKDYIMESPKPHGILMEELSGAKKLITALEELYGND